MTRAASSIADKRACTGGTIFDVPLPPELAPFGGSVRAAATGSRDNPPVFVLGGISADCFVCPRPDGTAGWWPGLVGPDCAVDPVSHYVIGADFAADASGAAAPTTHDQARVIMAVLDALNLDRPCSIVGASYGGMVGLALAAIAPLRVDRLVVISAAAEPHPAATAMRELQRRVVALGLEHGCAKAALAIARGMAMMTYRTPAEFEARFRGGIDGSSPLTNSDPGGYLRARGEAFGAGMSSGRYLSLSASIDRHRIDPAAISAPTLLIGATSDQLVPPAQLRRLATTLGGPAELHLLDSLYGHDMFLKEATRIGEIVRLFLEEAQ